jgi:hypothetical protein
MYLMALWYIFVVIFPVLEYCTTKNLAALFCTRRRKPNLWKKLSKKRLCLPHDFQFFGAVNDPCKLQRVTSVTAAEVSTRFHTYLGRWCSRIALQLNKVASYVVIYSIGLQGP